MTTAHPVAIACILLVAACAPGSDTITCGNGSSLEACESDFD
jgi:hypothetical protein